MDMNSLLAIVSTILVFSAVVVTADPQIKLVMKECSPYNVTNRSVFLWNLNATFSDLRSQLSNDTNRFATAQQPIDSDPVFAMVQCRNYLNRFDCIQCFDVAETEIRNCSHPPVGATVVYDGCFLRYERRPFFDQAKTVPGDVGFCSGRSVPQGTAFAATVVHLLSNLLVATPKINGYFAAVDQQVGNTGGVVVYAIAQCVNTVSQAGCGDCLTAAYTYIESCPPVAEARGGDAGCFLRYSDTAFFDSNQTTDITSLLGNGGSTNKAIIGAVVGGVVLFLLAAMFLIWLKVYRRKAKSEQRGYIIGATELKGPKNYEYKDLNYATRNFSAENKLGAGGFGDVYKGTLKNGDVIAVKKLAIRQAIRARADFANEVTLISNVHHRNLIRLLGCCNKSQELLLVYEYMAKSSLDKFLFGEKKGTLNWKQRLDIILGTARGLAYLHEEFHVCIIHRDIKSNNILLDDDFQPKIADFGLARLLPQDKTHINTRFAGTLGYTAPEYAILGELSPKVDIYSFGVVVLEIISGRRSNDMRLEPVAQYLLEWAWSLYEGDKLLTLVDESLDRNECQPEQVKKVVEIALLCTQSPAATRPTMSDVVVFLSSKEKTEFRPTRPTFVNSSRRPDEEKSTSTSKTTASSTSNASIATVLITETSGR